MMTETCGHEASHGGVAYRCERAPHPVDGYGPPFRHAAGIDAGYAERTSPGGERGEADLVTWGEDECGGDQEWELAWGTAGEYGTPDDGAAYEQSVTFPPDPEGSVRAWHQARKGPIDD